MSRKTLLRLLALPAVLYLIYLFGWQEGERLALLKPFIYESF